MNFTAKWPKISLLSIIFFLLVMAPPSGYLNVSAGVEESSQQSIEFPQDPLGLASLVETGGYHACLVTSSGGVKCWGYNIYGQLGDGSTDDHEFPVDVVGLSSGVVSVSGGGYFSCALTSSGGVKCWGDNYRGQLGDGTYIDRYTPIDVVGLSSGVSAISASGNHTCALTENGGVKCWGYNADGQLGDGTTENRPLPVDVIGLTSGVLAISSNYNHTCALLDSGSVKCWGDNNYGQLGNDSTISQSIPVDVVGLSGGVIALSAGGYHTCALINDGSVECWGSNARGQLGDGTTIQQNTPINVIGLTDNIIAISAGGNHTCAINNLGDLQCWGHNYFGEIGDGTTEQRNFPVNVTGLSNSILGVSAGFGYSCALTNIGGIECWGDNTYGQLGDGTTTIQNVPSDVIGIGSSSLKVSVGGNHTCALTDNGGVKCWGRNYFGQLGDGTTIDRIAPVDVIGLSSDVIAISSGLSHTCALLTNGGVKCWGSNLDGQLGDGTTISRSTPGDVTGLTRDVTAISSGMNHTCALTNTGGVKCWGYNSNGQLGDKSTFTRTEPVDVFRLTSGVQEISAGYLHTCALTTSGGVKCWGNNSDGQLGDGTTKKKEAPVDVFGLSEGVFSITAGGYHSCASTSSNVLKCWGNNGFGQLGAGTIELFSSIPIDVISLDSPADVISAGSYSTCATTITGNAICWGQNEYGQLGDGTFEDRNIPVHVLGLDSNGVQIDVGGEHACILLNNGNIKCWGDNYYGQLGDGTPLQSLTPIEVVGLRRSRIPNTSGENHTCGLTSINGVECWGDNDYGQLGDGTTVDRFTPVNVSGLGNGVLSVSAGDYHTCALTSAGGVKCWGNNSSGQLGDGTTIQQNFPVDVVGLTNGALAIAAGGNHTCALINTGKVLCWGENSSGQLGDGTSINHTLTIEVLGFSQGVINISAGRFHTCSLMSNGGVKCWGGNNSGQLGNGTTERSTLPSNVDSLSNGVEKIAAGNTHTCAVTNSGGVKCWGNNNFGQLGDGTGLQQNNPVDVFEFSTNAIEISAGGFHTCALSSDGGAKCWGDNSLGQIGNNTVIQQNEPADVVGLADGIMSISAGGSHNCVTMSSGIFRCWGGNDDGQLGTGDTSQRTTPSNVVGLISDFKTISTGDYFTCGLTNLNGIQCWGKNEYGQLGDGTTLQHNSPVSVVGLPGEFSGVSNGGHHSCALSANGGVKCWGDNDHGQLGDGTTSQQLIPVDVSDLTSGVIQVSLGSFYTCALTDSNGVKCWGDNSFGQLGDGTGVQQSIPVDVLGLSSEVIYISTGDSYACALTSNGGVKCWGNNLYGQLGDGTMEQRSSPVDVIGLTEGVISLATASSHTCALTNEGHVKCWGKNENGQLGDGSTTQSSLPIEVIGLSNSATVITAGGSHTCALTSDGRVSCWGLNNYGQLGDGTNISKNSPIDVTGLTGVVTDISAGYTHTCASTSSGLVKCWGDNNFGQIGDGTSSFSTIPLDVNNLLGWAPIGPAMNLSLIGNPVFSSFGWSVSNGGDINNDGYEDLIVGAPYYGSGGAVFIYYGSSLGLPATPDMTIESSEDDSRFGWSVGSADDVNNDGYDDIVVGAIGCSHIEVNEGCAYLYLGSQNGLNAIPVWSVESNQPDAALGYVVGTAGDVNGDLYSDIFATSPFYTDGKENEGAAFVYYGSATGPSTLPDWMGEGDQENAQYGLSASTALDTNDDGIDDFMVGAPNATGDLDEEGKVYLYLGGSTGLSQIAVWMVEGDQANAHFGEAIGTAGDVNGDGISDIVIGAPDYDWTEVDAGVAYVFLGSSVGLNSQADWIGANHQASARYGITVSSAGDINGDGYGDLLIGSNLFSNGQENEGVVYLYLGSLAGIESEPVWVKEGDLAMENFGYAFSTAGDINGDGVDDIIVGISQHGAADNGQVSIYSMNWITE